MATARTATVASAVAVKRLTRPKLAVLFTGCTPHTEPPLDHLSGHDDGDERGDQAPYAPVLEVRRLEPAAEVGDQHGERDDADDRGPRVAEERHARDAGGVADGVVRDQRDEPQRKQGGRAALVHELLGPLEPARPPEPARERAAEALRQPVREQG